MDSRTEIRIMEIVSYIMMGRDPNMLENTIYVQGKRDQLEDQAEKLGCD